MRAETGMTRPAATRDRAPGRLNLMAIPAAEVYLRGRLLGRTPLADFELPAGTHVLTLRPDGGGAPESVTVRIRPGELTRKGVRLGL